MRVSAALPPGVTALLFGAARARRELERRLLGGLEGAGYEEVLLPILDYWEPYEPLLTPASRGELYRFVGRGGELLALRADFTPLLARILAPRLPSLELPLRLFYRGDVVRYQEEQAGRMSEFYQLGAELVGEVPDGDREILTLFLTLLEASGAPQPQVVVGLAGALDEVLAEVAGPAAAELAVAVARRERARVRAASPALAEVVELGRPADLAALGARTAARLGALVPMLETLRTAHPGVSLTLDLAEFATASGQAEPVDGQVRSYYDGLIFRAFVGGRALAVGGGGRYDALFHRLGVAKPAVGFSLGLDRLAQISGLERVSAAGGAP